MRLNLKLREFFKKYRTGLYPAAGSFVMAAGWSWYHVAYRPHWRFVAVACLIWLAVFAAYQIFLRVYDCAVVKFHRHPWWRREFRVFLNNLFFLSSLLFLVFFSRDEILSLAYVSVLFLIIYRRLAFYLGRHPAAGPWLAANRAVFTLTYFIFLAQALWQYLSYHYYILDFGSRFYNIVFFRAWSMTMFWLLGFAVAGFIYWQFKGWWRYVLVGLWSLFFCAAMVIWAIDVGILYFSGLHFSPTALEHAKGSGGVVWNHITFLLLALLALILIGFVSVLRQAARAHRYASRRYWYFYGAAAIALAIFSLLGLASFKSTPENLVVKSFYQYFLGKNEAVEISPAVLKKLESFGLSYQPNVFYVSHHAQAFATTTAKLLPDKFLDSRPNVIIVFLESFSARLTSVHNKNLIGLTPGLLDMANNPGTTVFKKYFNASTPTVTGLMSELCSFLPPLGHDEVEKERLWQRHYLLCLPQILKDKGGYRQNFYMTAVDKDFANKDTILESMGVEKSYGQEELKKLISGEPLSWGYSDHQMFPEFWNLARTAQSPFLAMISTVDTHPPFNMAKDAVKYSDGKNDLLNSVHTTDDAFAKFWSEFKASPLYKNTIVVAMADHAVFPGYFSREFFPAETSRLTYYDENAFLMYVPDSILPKEVDRYSSSLDFTPTLLQVLGINTPNSFEGHSIFDDRADYPDILGMHEFGLYINQALPNGQRKIDYNLPSEISCAKNYNPTAVKELTLCDYLQFYKWKRQMLEEGRFWER